jgi:cytochrome P450
MLRAFGLIRRDPLRFLDQVRERYGDVVQLPIPVPATYVVTDPEAVRRVLVTNARNYGKRTLQYTSLSLVTGEGLLTADTEAWRPQRRAVQPAFHHESLELVADHVEEATARLLDRWRSEGAETVDLVVDMDEAMMHLALEVVGSSLFGSDLSEDADRLATATLRALDVVVKKARTPLPAPERIPTPTNITLRRAVRALDDAVEAMLVDRAAHPRAEGEPARDMLDLLLDAYDDGSAIGRAQLRDQIVTFIVAGHETVASALTWAWHLLAGDPESMSRLRAEAEALGGPPRFADLPRLPFTAAVVDEVLRLYPPAWLITRRSLGPDELAGVEIPGDALVIISPWLVHRHASVWTDPERFDPTRFLDEAGQRRRDVVAGPGYLPFGAGPRLCIGRDMALLEAVLVLAALVGTIDVAPVGAPPTAVPLVTIRPDHGLPMRVRLRTPAAASG